MLPLEELELEELLEVLELPDDVLELPEEVVLELPDDELALPGLGSESSPPHAVTNRVVAAKITVKSNLYILLVHLKTRLSLANWFSCLWIVFLWKSSVKEAAHRMLKI